MPWEVARNYLRGSEGAWNWCKERTRGLAVVFAPPTGNIWCIGDVSPAPQDYDRFVAWALKAQVIDAEQVKAQIDADIEWYPFPDREDLYHLKWFAEEVKTDVAYYAHQTFGGHTEYEFAFQFGSRERVLVYIENAGGQRVVEIDANCQRPIEGQTVLMSLMNALGFEMKTDFFAPHQRDFVLRSVQWEVSR